jgi:hypothetical protein
MHGDGRGMGRTIRSAPTPAKRQVDCRTADYAARSDRLHVGQHPPSKGENLIPWRHTDFGMDCSL